MKRACLFAVCMFTSFFIGFFYNNYLSKEEVVIPTYTEVTFKEENSLRSSIEKIYDSVVVIETFDSRGNKIGTGSGFCYKKDDIAYFITNNHVIENSNSIQIINMENKSYKATILGKDDYLDIAILSADKEASLQVATLSNSSSIYLGDTVFTIGSPLGYKYMGTITKGILSGKNRKVTISTSSGNYIMEVLQTDAAINPGNSGGPLVDINGEVIGVNSLKLVQDEIEGMGFAIPIELITESLSKLENGEVIIRPILGIEISDNNRYNGVYINNVDALYPAGLAGLKRGDYIISIDGEDIENSAHFRYIIYQHKIGDTIHVTYIRDGVTYETKVDLTKGI